MKYALILALGLFTAQALALDEKDRLDRKAYESSTALVVKEEAMKGTNSDNPLRLHFLSKRPYQR